VSPRAPDPRSGRARRGIIEAGPGFRGVFGDLRRHLRLGTVSTAVVAAVFGWTGPSLIIINGGREAGLESATVASWIFAVYILGGAVSVVMALYYRQPIAGAWSIPGAVLVVESLRAYSLGEMVGAYLACGVLLLVLALSGTMGRIMNALPLPIVMGMVAGVLIRFAIGVVSAAESAPLVVGAAVVGYLLAARLLPWAPSVVGALVLGAVTAGVTGAFTTVEGELALRGPVVIHPAFDLRAMAALAVPLAILVVSAQNAQGIGVLLAERYRPPVNAITLISGIGSILAAPFGGHNVNIAGPMTAICAAPDSGPREGRYASAVVNGLLFAVFGVFASVMVAAITVFPAELVSAVAGLAMVGVLLSAFTGAFATDRFQVGAFVSLVIAMSGVTILQISSPLWALTGGFVASLVLESQDFRTPRSG
jgi:benzoate membrane transport protein